MSKMLWQETTSVKRLVEAWEKVRRNNGTAGGDGLTIQAYSGNSAKRLADLSKRLRDGSFEPGPYRELHIPKRSGGSRRLMIPSLEDRIVHTAITQILVPLLEPAFEEASFAYRPGRSVQQAVAAIEKWRREGYEHVIEADIVSYFDAVNHDKLLQTLSRHLPNSGDNERLLKFYESDLAHQGDALGTPGLGLAQGSPL